MIRKSKVEIEKVLHLVIFESPSKGKNNPHLRDIEGDLINMSSWRYQTFCTSGLVCVRCGIEGKFFAKEKSLETDARYHLNLYAEQDGKEILMTKDHILPKSRGGKDTLSNFQTMCTICNFNKGNTLEK